MINSNIREGFSNDIFKDTNAVDKKIKERSLSGNKNNIGSAIKTLLIYLVLAIISIYLGSTLIFFIWSIGITNCKKRQGKELFEYFFPTFCDDEDYCKHQMSGGSVSSDVKSSFTSNLNNSKRFANNHFKDIKDCIRKNENLNDFCTNTGSKSSYNWDNPGLMEWFLKSFKETNHLINSVFKYGLQILPSGEFCGLTFFFALPFYSLLFGFCHILPIISGLLFIYHNIINGFDYFWGKNKGTSIIIKFIKLIVGIIFTFFIFMGVGIVNSVMLMLKSLFYPLVIGASDVLLKIVKQNIFIVKIELIIISIAFISSIKNSVNDNLYKGILIGYTPLLLFNLWSLLNSFK